MATYTAGNASLVYSRGTPSPVVCKSEECAHTFVNTELESCLSPEDYYSFLHMQYLKYLDQNIDDFLVCPTPFCVAVHSKHEQSVFCPACLKDVRIPQSSTDVACIGSMNDEESEGLLEDNLISSQDPGCEDLLRSCR